MMKRTEKIDEVIGNRIYTLRRANGLSLDKLSKLINVTFQQLQKYEKGKNRISVGRLILISKALNKNISYFIEEFESSQTEQLITKQQRMCIEVSRNFMKIENIEHQQAAYILIKSLAEAA